MKIISHRGNIEGPIPEKENHPDYILESIRKGFDAEIDLRVVDDKLYLGHDEPQYEIDVKFLYKEGLWIHAKNIDAAYFLSLRKAIHWFFHDQDDCVLTSRGYLWTYPGKQLTENSVAVMPERVSGPYSLSGCYGVCSDYPLKYLEYIK